MKKRFTPAIGLIILILVTKAQLFAQPFELTFGMTVQNGTPDSVYVENQQKGTDIMLLGGDILLLTIPTATNEISTGGTELIVFPNPVKERAVIRFYNPQNGPVSVKLFDITGRQIASQKENLAKGDVQYLVTELPTGTFLLHVTTVNRFYSAKLISSAIGKGNPRLFLQGVQSGSSETGVKDARIKSAKGASEIKSMEYSNGETLTLKAYYTGATAEDTIVPTSNMEFEFGIFYYTLTDYELNTYLAVQIDTQVWMAENLKVTHYPDGNSIPKVTDDEVWKHLKDKSAEAAYCYYDNDKDSTYGVLYSWPAALGGKGVDSNTNPSGVQGVCPAGWHLPSMAEWIELRDFISQDGHFLREGKALKSTEAWTENGNGTDDYGFCALPGGQRGYSDWSTDQVIYYGDFIGKGNNGCWWTSTYMAIDAAAFIMLSYNSSRIKMASAMRSNGYSIRCVKD